MILQKVKEKGIDLFILIIDDMNYKYEAHEYMAHADYNSFKLVFSFEDWTKIINDEKEHIFIIGEYVNADDSILVKFSNENFDELLNEIKEWNNKHKIENKHE